MTAAHRQAALFWVWGIALTSGLVTFAASSTGLGRLAPVLILLLTATAVTLLLFLSRAQDAEPAPPDLSSGTPDTPWTPREREVLRLIVEGCSNNEIAQSMVVSRSTVKTHINNVYRKLGVRNRVQAAVQARKLGLIS